MNPAFIKYHHEDDLPENDKQFLKNKVVDLKNWNWSDSQSKTLFPAIDEWLVEELMIEEVEFKTMPIFHIKLNNLRILYLYFISLDSVEALHRTWMPALEQLSVSGTQITTVSSLRKGFWPKLSKIGVHDNKAPEVQELMEFKCSELYTIMAVEWEAAQLTDPRWIIKLQVPNVELLCYHTNRQISMQPFEATLRKKYKDVQFRIKVL